jgi:hypothetical protein
MTTILTDKRLVHIGRRSELGPGDGMTFHRRLIRSDEDLARRAPHKAATGQRLSLTASRASPPKFPRGSLVVIDQNLLLERACLLSWWLRGDCRGRRWAADVDTRRGVAAGAVSYNSSRPGGVVIGSDQVAGGATTPHEP